MTEPKRMAGGVALNFPVNEEETTSSSLSTPLKAPPRRLRRRLLAEPKAPLSSEDIEAKLREANIRRQQFYEFLSSKAKPKSRSSPQTSCLREDLAQRLEASLNAAEQKRLSILTSAQMHLARLDETWQAAKSGVERHFEKEPDELGIKVQSQVEQAEAKPMLLLKVHKQREAAKREQAALSLKQKISMENNYTLCVRAAIYKKRAPAERKRLGLLEGEQMRACTRLLKVRQIAQSVNGQQKTKRKEKKDQLEDRLKRAKRQRAEYLRQRRNLSSHLHASKMIHEQEEYLSRKLARYWRRFVKLRKTTFYLAKTYVSLGINEESVKAMPFEQLAIHIKSTTTINMVKALVDRLESRLRFSWAVRGCQSSLANIDHLLRFVAFPNYTGNSGNPAQRGAKTTKSDKEEAQMPVKLSRYPVRVVLCAYMIIGHPDAVLNGQGRFELLVEIIIDGPIQFSRERIASAIPSQKTFRFQLEACDKAWCHYLRRFATWKLKDAKLLEEDLVRAACQLEFSMMQSKLTLGDDETLSDDMEVIKKQTIEKAFWDSIMESVKQDEPDFSWILKLIQEVRDELCEMSPQTWRQEIVETIDVDILSQVLRSGTLDMDYLGKILEFALATLEKLSAPANDEEMKSSHHKLLEELREISKVGVKSNASISFVVIKGLWQVLQEIQALKREISKACIRFVEPLIKGHTGLEYLKNAFANRYGLPTDALSSLTLTRQWLSSVHPIAEQEWDEYIDSLSALTSNLGSSQVLLPTTLRTGGAISVVSKIGSSATGSNKPGCNGERVDKLVRRGLLKLVSGIGGLTPEALPETLKLDISRLRSVQSQFQKTIVISTSLLILCQILLTEKLVTNSLDMENIVSEVMKQLYELLDSVEDVGISEIVAKISGLLKGNGLVFGAEKLQAKEMLMENVLGKSSQARDPIFARVSDCIYQALRGVVFGGSGNTGRELAVAALQRVRVALLADRVMEAAEVLIVVATVSCSVHRTCYEKLLNK
ncbi:hypothetical protein P3X46_028252 [Hevea brasiliensis]|uniref:T-complex protein 11 n=1 Tax=Hevea brasiliensis TaxID=3981 RepID=A0ABQ9KP19_HEVBR|nr:hypothetical protein P3X46_028252 [Hevea brasiliensis]